MKHLLRILSLCLLATITTHTLSAQVYVRANSPCNSGCGGSWADAYRNLQDALANTAAGEIWVARGIYKPVDCNSCTDADRQLFFPVKPGIALYGGFAGTEASLSQRNISANPTILSGDIGLPADSTDNAYRVLIADNSTANTILDGFIIEDGNADGSFGFSAGGGLLINANPGGTGDIQVRNCTFRNNYAGGGGAVAIDCVLGGVSNALFQNCLFEGNTASLRVVSSGAAIFMQGNAGARVSPRIVGCTFRDNSCGNDGGAISATPTGEGSLLAFEVDSCRFEGNRAADRGGAIWYRMTSGGQSAVVIRNSQFLDNRSGGQGGAIFARSSFDNIANDTLINCLFLRNTADGSSDINDGEGGAVFLRGSQAGTRNHQIINCVFAQNSASERGGALATTSVFVEPGTIHTDLINCTFYGNTTQGEGGAIYADGADGDHTLNIVNSILWKDEAAGGGKEILNNNAVLNISHSDIENGLPENANDGGQNLAIDPLLIDPPAGNFRLSPCSPATDAGLDTAIPLDLIDMDYDSVQSEPIGIDLDGHPRIFGSRIDLGAYEWNGEPTRFNNLAVQIDSLSCGGSCDGQITVTPVTGQGPYQYLWSDQSNDNVLSGLCAGIYSVTVTDQWKCSVADTFELLDKPSLEILATPDTAICAGAPVQLSVEAFNNNGPMRFAWTQGLGTGATHSVAPEISTLYIVEGRDRNSCRALDSVFVTVYQQLDPSISGQPSFCSGTPILLDAGPFPHYLWSTGDTTRLIEISEAGAYSVTVSDRNGCQGEAAIEVNASEEPQPQISGQLSLCEGASTTLNAGVFTAYLWNTGDTTQTIIANQAGAYSVTVTNEHGCQGQASAEVTVNENLQPQISGQLQICEGASTTLDAGSFTTYLWSNGRITRTIDVMQAGDYAVTVADDNGCLGQAAVEVTVNTPPEPQITGQLSICPGGGATLDAGPFSNYLWNTGDTTQTIEATQAGAYAVTVTDPNGCQGETAVSVIPSDMPAPTISGVFGICDGDSTALDAGGPFTAYLWNTGDTTAVITARQDFTYSVTVTDADGCTRDTFVRVRISENPQPQISGTLAICPGETTQLDAGVFAAYRWSTGDTTQTVAVTQAGDYAVTVANAAGCSGETAVTVTQTSAGPVNFTADQTQLCRGEEALLTVNGAAEITWLDAGRTDFSRIDESTALVTPTADFTYQVAANNGCALDTLSLTISVFDQPVVDAGPDQVILPGESVQLNAGGASEYTWSPATALSCTACPDPIASPSQTITYTVAGINEAGCRGEDRVTISVKIAAQPPEELYSGITPNGDGLNDELVFGVLESEIDAPNNELIIFNRWGDIVYRASPYVNDWKGVNQNGQDLPAGTYYYILRIDLGEGLVYQGDVTVLR